MKREDITVADLLSNDIFLKPLAPLSFSMIDHGNPFFTRFYAERKATRDHWNSECIKDEIGREAYYCLDLVQELSSYRNDSDARWTILHLWASRKCTAAFQEYTKQAERRLYYIDCVQKWEQDITHTHRIDALRNHGSILQDTRLRVSTLVDKLQKPLEKYLSKNYNTHQALKEQTKELIQDLTVVLRDIGRLIETNQRKLDYNLTSLQIDLANTQLIESRKSIEQNDTVKRLTMLAFVYIPISTISSLFGMNVSAITGESTATPLWKFIAICVPVVVFTIIMACFESIQSYWEGMEGFIIEVRDRSYATASPRPWLISLVHVLFAILAFCFRLWQWIYLPFKMLYYAITDWRRYGEEQKRLNKRWRGDIADQDQLRHTRSSPWFDYLAHSWRQEPWYKFPFKAMKIMIEPIVGLWGRVDSARFNRPRRGMSVFEGP
jgi:hypothetical protein